MISHTHNHIGTPGGPGGPVLQPCEIFLIEDDLDDQILARREMEKSPYVKEVTTFSSGEKLIAYMKKRGFMDHSVLALTPILMVVDLEMPVRDGLSVIQELKSDNFLKEIPLIVVTGTKQTDKINRARELGANGVFRKPLKQDVLTRFFKDAWKWPPEDIWMS